MSTGRVERFGGMANSSVGPRHALSPSVLKWSTSTLQTFNSRFRLLGRFVSLDGVDDVQPSTFRLQCRS